MTATRSQARWLDRTGDMLRIAWIRAYRFPPLPPPAPHSKPTPMRTALTWWFALTLWPMVVVTLALEAHHVRVLGDASCTLKPRHPRRYRWALTTAGIGIGLCWLAGVVALDAAAATGNWVALTGLAVFLVSVMAALASRIVVVARSGPGAQQRVRDLIRRRNEFAPGPGYVLTALAARRDGTHAGTRLIEALKDEWAAEGAVVVLHAASDSLVTYYHRLGATTDEGHRMTFAPGTHRPVSSTTGQGVVTFLTGDLFTSRASAIGHGVNVVGRMSAGVAAQIRRTYPEAHEVYRAQCRTKALQPGATTIWFPPAGDSRRALLNIASQARPGRHAQIQWLRTGLGSALALCEKAGITSLAVPRIGCGIGGLRWQDVRPVIESATATSPVTVEVWALPADVAREPW